MVTRVLNHLVAACILGSAVCMASAAPAAAAVGASLSPTSGPPGTAVTVSGGGFDPSARVDVFIDLTDIAAGASTASGAVTISVRIPTTVQPGTHWITLDEVHANRAAQAMFTIVTSWPQVGYGPSGRAFNPFENTINPANADQLTVAWSRPLTTIGFVKPFVVLRGNAYVFDENGKLWALSPTGAALWLATAGPPRIPQAAPIANRNSIFTGDINGVVRAFPSLCRRDGGVCTAARWVAHLGAAINGMTYRSGLLYASGQDGLVHVINAATGALGTSITPGGATSPVTQPVAFAPDGSYWIVQGTSVTEVDSTGYSITQPLGSTVSAVAVGTADGYATTLDGKLHSFTWVTPMGMSGCVVPPAFARGLVYAASCTTIGAYDPDTSIALWTITSPGAPRGLAVANGVLYACVTGRVVAFDASNGARLGNGGKCTGAPEIVDGTVYSVHAGLYAATLDGVSNTAFTSRPDPRVLRPTVHPRRGHRP